MFTFYHTLGIAAIVKNEAPYIDEWLTYHRAAGVTKFYIYDNGSTDGTRDILHSYADKGLVELIDYPLVAGQLQAYNDAICRSRFVCKYLALVDVDEFLVAASGKTLPLEMENLMKKNPDAAGMGARWRCFGSAGEKNYRDEEVTKRFCYRAEDDFEPNIHIKSIFNPRLAEYVRTPHNVEFLWGWCLMSVAGEVIPGYAMPQLQKEGIFVYHYFVKSEEEFRAKIKRGTADGTVARNMDYFHIHDRNEVFDDTAWQYFRKWQVMPYREKDRKQVDSMNRWRLQEIKAGSKADLTEILCHFFAAFRQKDKDGQEAVAKSLYQKMVDEDTIPVDQVLLLVDILPELVSCLQTSSSGFSKDWKKAISAILDGACYEARRFYQAAVLKRLCYSKAMLDLIAK